jgi:hypothetical protein
MPQSDKHNQIDQANGPSNASLPKNAEYASVTQIRGLGLALVGLILLMSYLFLSLWPGRSSEKSKHYPCQYPDVANFPFCIQRFGQTVTDGNGALGRR